MYRKSCKAADSYNESSLNDNSIKGVDSSIGHSLRESWDSNSQDDITHIVYKAQTLLEFQNGSVKTPHVENQNATEKHFGKISWHNKPANVVKKKCNKYSSGLFKNRSTSAPVLAINASASSYSRSIHSLSSSTLTSLATSICAACYDPAHFTLSCAMLPRDVLPKIAALYDWHIKGETKDNRTQRFLAQIAASTNIDVFNTTDTLPFRLDETLRSCSPHTTPFYRQKKKKERTRAETLVKHTPDPPPRQADTHDSHPLEKEMLTESRPKALVQKTRTHSLFPPIKAGQKLPYPLRTPASPICNYEGLSLKRYIRDFYMRQTNITLVNVVWNITCRNAYRAGPPYC